MHYATKIAPATIDDGPIPFDLYATDFRDHIVLFCRAGFKITARHQRLLKDANRVFYISSRDLPKYYYYTSDRIEMVLNHPMIGTPEKVKILQGVERVIVRMLLDDPDNSEVFDRAGRTIECHVELVLRHPEVSDSLFEIAGEDSYTLAHSINVCTFCMLIGEMIMGRSRRDLWQLGMAGLLLICCTSSR